MREECRAHERHPQTHRLGQLGDDGVELRKLLGLRVFGAAMDETTAPGDDGLFDELPQKVVDALNQLRETIERRESRP